MQAKMTLEHAQKQLRELIRQKNSWERVVYALEQEQFDFEKETEENFAQLRLRNVPKANKS